MRHHKKSRLSCCDNQPRHQFEITGVFRGFGCWCEFCIARTTPLQNLALCLRMRPCDMRNDGVQKFVVLCHVITIFCFLVEPQTQIIYGVLLANSRCFKQIQHLFRIDTPVTDIPTVSDINRIVGVNGLAVFCCLSVFAFVC